MTHGQSETWRALMREATSAAAHMGLGVTTLGRANHAEYGYYSQAFFALSVGIERAAKLALSMNQARSSRAFADRQTMTSYGHDLGNLLAEADAVANGFGLDGDARMPSSTVQTEIVSVLTDFANNLTRYYDLEFVGGDPRAVRGQNPISAWHTRVTATVLEEHDTPALRDRREAKAAELRSFEDMAVVHHSTETGEPIDSMEAGAVHASTTEFARRWERVYVLQICRFLANLLVHLSDLGRGDEDMPEFRRLFSIFLMDDAYFRSRATWSIYKP